MLKKCASSLLDEVASKSYLAIMLIATLLFAVATALSLWTLIALFDPASRDKFYWIVSSGKAFVAGLAVVAVFLLLLLLLLMKDRPKLLCGLFVVGVLFRLLLCFLVSPVASPFSDYDQVWQIAQGTADERTLLYKSFFPEWSNWAALLKVFVSVFHIDYSVLIWFESILGCLISFETVVLTQLIVKKKAVALSAGCIYVFMPSQILFSFVCKPDTLSLFFILAGMIACVKLYQLRADKGWKLVVVAVVAGFLLSAGTVFKPVALIALIAFALCWIMLPSLQTPWWKESARKIVPIVIVGAMITTLPSFVRPLTSEELGTDVSSSATLSYLCVGLNTEGEGQIHLGSKSRFYNNARLAGATEQEASASTIEMLKEDWMENADRIPSLLLAKIRWAWQDDMIPAEFAGESIPSLSGMLMKVLSIGAAASQFYYLFLVAAAAGFLVLVIKRRDRMNFGLAFILLYILGFALLLLISEAQSRYKSNIMPMISIVSALGLYEFMVWIRTIVANKGMTRKTERESMDGVCVRDKPSENEDDNDSVSNASPDTCQNSKGLCDLREGS